MNVGIRPQNLRVSVLESNDAKLCTTDSDMCVVEYVPGETDSNLGVLAALICDVVCDTFLDKSI